MTHEQVVERIESLIKKHVVQHDGDWYNDDKAVHAAHPEGVLLLRKSGVEYFSGGKSHTYERCTFDYYERDALGTTDDKRYAYYQVTPRSVRRIDVKAARRLFDKMWEGMAV